METEKASREGDGEKQYAVVWDFDWTLINENSDTFIVDRISHDARLEMKELRKRMGWTQLMDHMMQKLQPSRDTLRSLMREIPFFSEIVNDLLVRFGRDPRCKQFIVSDANSEFINIFISEHALQNCFDAIYTNPAYWEKGVLRVSPYVDFAVKPHGCSTCASSQNMCKGAIIEEIMQSVGTSEILYLGDGRGDLCAAMHLRSIDTVFPREGFALHRELQKGVHEVHAQSRAWMDGETLGAALMSSIP